MRWLLIPVLLACGGALAQQPTRCSEMPPAVAQATGEGHEAALHPGKSVAVEVIFQRGYKGKGTEEWTDGAMNDVCEAARHLAAIWSSREFQQALAAEPDLVLQADKHGRVMRRISGAELLDEILNRPSVLMSVAVRSSLLVAVPQCAESNYMPGETLLQGRYLTDRKTKCSDAPLLPALTNTLGHEFTHYEWIGATDEGKNAEYDPRYVSYGVGCLTQTIGFPDSPCKYGSVAIHFSKKAK